jgi:hypothetical protein
MGRKTEIETNSDGFEIRKDFEGIEWPEVDRKFDEDMGALIEKHIQVENYWYLRWKNGDNNAINQYRKEVAHHNRKDVWPFHTLGVIGTGTGAKVSAETTLELYNEAYKKGDKKAAEELLTTYVNKFRNESSLKTFLMEAIMDTDKTMEQKELIGKLTRERMISLLTKKAEKAAKTQK